MCGIHYYVGAVVFFTDFIVCKLLLRHMIITNRKHLLSVIHAYHVQDCRLFYT